MKRIFCVLLTAISMCACGNAKIDQVNMQYVETKDYRAIEWEGRLYVPWSVTDRSTMGKRIGIVGGDENDGVYEAEGLPSEQWIISFFKSGEMDNPMLMKEQDATEIPEGFSSEYEWNN